MNARFCLLAAWWLLLSLLNPVTGAGAAVISNPPPMIQFGSSTYGIFENQTNSIDIYRFGDTNVSCSVQWSFTGGTATPLSDFFGGSSTINFAPGQIFTTLPIFIVDDSTFEADETANFLLHSPTDATVGALSNAVLTIFNNDASNPPTATIRFVASTYGRFEDQTAPINLERIGDTNGACSVDWSFTGGSAAPFSDFLGGSATINFAPGQTIAALPVSIVDDGLVESNETANFSLINPFNATLGSPSAATLTIFDNDGSNAPPAAVVQFITDGYGRFEDTGDASLTVTRSGNTSNACSVNWSVTGGSATAVADYNPSSGTLSFAAGETFKNISLLIVDDGLVETNETVHLALSGATNCAISFPSNAVLTIFDNDVSNPPPVTVVQFITDVYGRTEDTGDALITVTRSGNSSNACSVNWSATGGSATAGNDYNPSSGTLNFAAGDTFKHIHLFIVDDLFVEGSETVNLALSQATNCLIGSPSNAVLTIFDNDNINTPTTDLAITVHPETNVWLMGQEVLIQYAVTNRGPNNASNIVVHAPIPPGLQFTGTDGNLNWGFDFDAGTWTRQSALVTNSISFFGYRLRATNGGLKTFTGTISNSQPADAFPGNNTATTNLAVVISLSITGQVLCASNGPPLPGVTITVTTTNAPARVAVTDTNGGYAFTNLTPALYTVTPSTNGFSFAPVNQVIDAMASTNLPPFIATPRFIFGFVLSGTNASPLPGIAVQLTGAASATMLTDSNGMFIFTNLNAGNYTVTPLTNTVPHARFTPTNATFALGNPTNWTNSVTFYLTNGIVMLRALEVVQVSQDWVNSVPLIAKKQTLVRAHLELAGTNTAPVEVSGARLWATNLATGAKTSWPPKNGSIMVRSNNAAYPPLRSNITTTLNFPIPDLWNVGRMEYRLEWTNGVLVPIEPAETGGVASNASVKVSYTNMPDFGVRFIKVAWTNAITNITPTTTNYILVTNAPTEAEVDEQRRRVISTYPITKFETLDGYLFWSATNGAPDDAGALLDAIEAARVTSTDTNGSATNRIWYGLTTKNKIRGVAYIGKRAGVGKVSDTPGNFQRHLSAHEIGHTLSRPHAVHSSQGRWHGRPGTTAGFCDERGDNRDIDFPIFKVTPFGFHPTLGPVSNDNFNVWGYDHYLKEVISPYFTFDLMSYCHGDPGMSKWPWSSKYTYTNIQNSILGRFGTNGALPPAIHHIAKNLPSYMLIRGEVDLVADTAKFRPSYPIAPGTLPTPEPGDYLLRIVDGLGQSLFEVAFEPQEPLTERDDGPTVAHFQLEVPVMPNAVGAILFHGGVPIGVLNGSANPPSVALIQPNGGEVFGATGIQALWSGNDPDGDPLHYLVQFSADGGAQWTTISLDLDGSTLDIPPDVLAATAHGKIRVIASDGFRFGYDDSNGEFIILNHGPAVAIVSPTGGELFFGEQGITFNAHANDLEDGALSGTNLVWSSDRDGALGTGETLVREVSELSEGAHLVTLTAYDSGGMTNTATVTMNVSYQEPPRLHIALDPPDAVLWWSINATNYRLQRALSLPGSWADVTNAVELLEDKVQTRVPAGGPSKFFRLVKP